MESSGKFFRQRFRFQVFPSFCLALPAALWLEFGFSLEMKLVATCSDIHEAQTIASRLKSDGMHPHVLEVASANIRIPGIPVTANVMVPNHQAMKAQILIQKEFPSQRSAGIRLCERCIDLDVNGDRLIQNITVLRGLWISFMGAFFFKSYCPNCRRLH